MEEQKVNNADNQQKNEEGFEINFADKKVRTIAIAIVAALVILPLIYIFTSGPSTPDAPVMSEADMKIAEMEKTVAANPTYDNYLNLSAMYINNGRYSQSLDPLNKALAQVPNSVVAFSNKGYAYAMMGYWGEAKGFLDQAMKIDSTFQLAKNNSAWVKGEIAKRLESIKVIQKKAQDSITTTDYVNMGLTYASVGMYDKCTEMYEKSIEKDKNNEIAYNNLGMQLVNRDNKTAIKMFEKAIEINPTAQLYKNNLAWAQSLLAAEGAEKKAIEQPTQPGVAGSQNPDRSYGVGK